MEWSLDLLRELRADRIIDLRIGKGTADLIIEMKI
jgi:hypothetical protein